VSSARSKLVSGNVLVTGATGGIGQAVARAFAARGARLVLTGRRQDVLDSLCAELGARGIACDLSRAAEVERLAAEAGDVDVVIANAALPASGSFIDLTPGQIETMLDVNLRAPILLASALAPQMARRRSGHLLFMSSLSGKAASPVSSIYSATKFGLRGFSLGLREDLRRDRVGVSVVLPGFVRGAGMFHDAGVKLPPGVGTSTPEEVAEAIIGAIERNRAEVSVAPLPLRLGASIASVAPGMSSTLQRFAGGGGVARRMSAGQAAKRPPAEPRD
jgi:short-subunit dehydrogenase